MKITITIKFPPQASEQSILVFKERISEVLRHDLLEAVKAAMPEDDKSGTGGDVEVVTG